MMMMMMMMAVMLTMIIVITLTMRFEFYLLITDKHLTAVCVCLGHDFDIICNWSNDILVDWFAD